MAQLVVGGVTIPVAPGNASRDRDDFTDRRRSFDGTYRASQTGGAARTWRFRTPPITRTLADSYEATLGIVAAQMCSGDLLGIPTMCCAQIDSGWNAIKAASGHYVELPFTLHEVQPAKLFSKYSPGTTISGESFTRSTGQLYYDVNGIVIQSLGVNAKADSHYIGGVRSLLLEDTRTNSLLRSNEFNNAAWTKSSMTITTGIADPAGGTTACTLTATGATAFAQQTLAAGSSLVRTNSVWLRRRTGTGSIQIRSPDAVNVNVTLTATWQRFFGTGAASTLRDSIIFVNVSGDEVDAWGYQMEDGSFASSFFPTTTAAATRGVCSYSLPFTALPGEITVYAKFIELGTVRNTGARIFEIGIAASSSPRFLVQAQPTVYGAFHGNGTANVTSNLAAGPAIGDTVELVARLYGDGSIDLIQSLNGGAATSSTQSAANALATAWSDDLLWLNSGGTSAGSTGFIALQSFKVVAGMRSLVDMRAA